MFRISIRLWTNFVTRSHLKDAAEQQLQERGDCTVKIAMADGLPGLHQSFGISVQGVTVYQITYYGCYNTIKGLLPNPKTPFKARLEGVLASLIWWGTTSSQQEVGTGGSLRSLPTQAIL